MSSNISPTQPTPESNSPKLALSQVAVEVNNLSKSYKIYPNSLGRAINAFGIPVRHKIFHALKDVSVSFPKGEVIAILGKNGSGKSTLLKIIAGVVTPSEGTSQAHGRISAMLELTSGFDPELTGIENIYLKALTMGISNSEITQRVDDIAAFADIGDHINQPFRTYSSGMKARLGFAVAVNVDPEILIVDEVLAVGDDIFKMKCIDKMNEFRTQGKTILFVSHALFTVKAFCTKGIWINKGELMAEGDLGDVIVQYEDFLKVERARIREELTVQAIESGGPVQRALDATDLIEMSDFAWDREGADASGAYLTTGTFGFSFNYEVKQETSDLYFCFTIRDMQNDEVYMLNKRRYRVDNEIGHHTVRLHVPYFSLLPGDYKLSGEIWEINSSMHVSYSNRQIFTVKSEEFYGTGNAYFAHELIVDGTEVRPSAINDDLFDSD